MNLIGQTKILTDYGSTSPVWNSKWHIFKILRPFRKSGYWRSYCSLQSEGDFHTVHTKKSKRFDIKIFKLCDSTGYTYDMKLSVPGEGQTAHSKARDSNPCDSDRTDKGDRRTWPQIIPGQFIFFPWIIWWFGEETDLLLWYWQLATEVSWL